MNSKDFRDVARMKLEYKIFGTKWLIFAIVFILFEVIIGAASGISFGLGLFFVFGALSIGCAFISLKISRGNDPIDLSDLFVGFKENYTKNLLIGMLYILFISLWSLLFIIPGIVKQYSYSMAFYISIDHPELEPRECLDQSRELMNGNKGRLLILQLSFIGYFLLSVVTFGIAIIWVVPYVVQAKTAFYEDLINGVEYKK